MRTTDDSKGVAALRRALLDFYDRRARALPWRGATDPYRVLVSEVMLQQTRVETVKRYYGAWLERFPDVAALAEAEEDEVLKAWEGLGYYRRARNLHRAARVVRDRGRGVLPSDYEGLRELPGVGEYTAGAVASIAFGARTPAVDGNVRRVLARLHDVAEPKESWLRGAATGLLDAGRPGDWNQAVMELGATVCKPRRPACGECPLADWCAARAAGTVLDRPAPRRERGLRRATFLLGVFHAEGAALLVRRPEAGLLGGLWALPEVEAGAGRRAQRRPLRAVRPALEGLAEELGLSPVQGPRPLPPCEHRFTHLHATYEPWSVAVAEAVGGEGRAWRPAGAETGHALPVAQRRVLRTWSTAVGREAIEPAEQGVK